jgi:hypothetical protein
MIIKEQEYNIAVGISPINCLPEFLKEPIPGTDRSFDVNQNELNAVWQKESNAEITGK